ncbi:MAG TPA: universal stress protein, partial [Blastocatellia bacterium]|nr:universal stress protein [Blastocatellia bacterium]
MKILLAIDGSSFSDTAVDEVAGKPWPENSEVKIISVAEPPTIPAIEPWMPTDAYFQQLEKVAEEQAQNIVDRAGQKVGRRQ